MGAGEKLRYKLESVARINEAILQITNHFRTLPFGVNKSCITVLLKTTTVSSKMMQRPRDDKLYGCNFASKKERNLFFSELS